MRIANIMLSRGYGGIEQAFIDYTEALTLAGHEVHAVTRAGAAINRALAPLAVTTHPVSNGGLLELNTAFTLWRTLHRLRPEILIAHGNRALSLSRHVAPAHTRIVGVTHNYSIKRLKHADGIFATTEDLAAQLRATGIEDRRIFAIPNMVRLPEAPRTRRPSTPLHIGAMGRFVHKKGFHIFIDALRQLREQQIPFTATLGGDGVEADGLKAQAVEAGLTDLLSFSGWVEDKAEFFNSMDLFCLPSLHEPFGIVLLEAFAHDVPVITTDSEGPASIATHGLHALIAPRDDSTALAQHLRNALATPDTLPPLAAAGKTLVQEHYTLEAVAPRMDAALRVIVERT